MPVFIALPELQREEGTLVPFGTGHLAAELVRHLDSSCPAYLEALSDPRKAEYGKVRNTRAIADSTYRCDQGCWHTFEGKEKDRGTAKNPGSISGAPAIEDRKAYAQRQRAEGRRKAKATQ